MRLGIVITRIGGVDGVALETEKWICVLKRLGFQVFVLTGNLEGELEYQPEGIEVFEELALDHPNCIRDQEQAYFGAQFTENELRKNIEDGAQRIYLAIEKFVQKNEITHLLAQNNLTLPCHLSMGLGLKRYIANSGLPSVSHNHDFYWERGERYETRSDFVKEVMQTCFPPQLENLKHAVINTYNQGKLKEKGMESLVVPNVMDFDQDYGFKDEYNSTLPESLGIQEGELPLFQITRIVRRKGIETAIDLVHKLKDSRVKLFITGSAKDDEKMEYLRELQAQIQRLKLAGRVFFVSDIVQSQRNLGADGEKIYSLSDAYAHASAMTYFSTYEGFGNVFVEAVLARVVVFVNNYEPVYWPDIGSKGFRTVQIEGSNLNREAVENMREVINNGQLQKEMADHNFELGREHFSFQVLQRKIKALFNL